MSELCQLCHCEVSQETRNPGTPEGVAYDWCKVRAIKHCEDTARSCKNSSIVQIKQHSWLIATKKWALNLSLSLQNECMVAYFGVVASYRRTALRTTLLKLWAYELHASSFSFYASLWHNGILTSWHSRLSGQPIAAGFGCSLSSVRAGYCTWCHVDRWSFARNHHTDRMWLRWGRGCVHICGKMTALPDDMVAYSEILDHWWSDMKLLKTD